MSLSRRVRLSPAFTSTDVFVALTRLSLAINFFPPIQVFKDLLLSSRPRLRSTFREACSRLSCARDTLALAKMAGLLFPRNSSSFWVRDSNKSLTSASVQRFDLVCPARLRDTPANMRRPQHYAEYANQLPSCQSSLTSTS